MVVCLGVLEFKDLQASFEEDAETEAPLEIQDLRVVPKRATRGADIGDWYGVGLQDEGEDIDDEALDHPSECANSSSSNLSNPPMVLSVSSNRASQLVFMYGVGEVVLQAMKRGRMHECGHSEFKAICTSIEGCLHIFN